MILKTSALYIKKFMRLKKFSLLITKFRGPFQTTERVIATYAEDSFFMERNCFVFLKFLEQAVYLHIHSVFKISTVMLGISFRENVAFKYLFETKIICRVLRSWVKIVTMKDMFLEYSNVLLTYSFFSLFELHFF